MDLKAMMETMKKMEAKKSGATHSDSATMMHLQLAMITGERIGQLRGEYENALAKSEEKNATKIAELNEKIAKLIAVKKENDGDNIQRNESTPRVKIKVEAGESDSEIVECGDEVAGDNEEEEEEEEQEMEEDDDDEANDVEENDEEENGEKDDEDEQMDDDDEEEESEEEDEKKLKPKRKAKRKTAKRVICPYCGDTYTARYLPDHIKIHTGQLPKCNICGKTDANPYRMREHIKGHATGLKPLQCDKCDKGYVNGRDLRKHLLDKHSNEKPFKCNICGIGYDHEFELLQHKRYALCRNVKGK